MTTLNSLDKSFAVISLLMTLKQPCHTDMSRRERLAACRRWISPVSRLSNSWRGEIRDIRSMGRKQEIR